MRSMLQGASALTLVLALASAAGGAEPAPLQKAGQTGPAKQKKGDKTGLDVERLKKALESGDEAQVLGALEELAAAKEADRPQAAELDALVLGRGGSTKVLVQALVVAEKLGQKSSSTAVVPYVRHRQGEVRRAAVMALTRTGGSEAVQALRDALRGSDAQLRGFAASGLATLKAHEAVADLFSVLPRGVPEAASAIGELCRGAECPRFVDLMGKLPFDLMDAGLTPILLRVDPEVGEAVQLDVVMRLRRLQTKQASEILATALAQFPPQGSPKVKAALEAHAAGKPLPKETP
jgi:HEAT repeat protein